MISKEFTRFASLLFIIARQIVVGNEFCCPKEIIYWGSEQIPVTWPETSASNSQIAFECMLNTKQLLPRMCDSRISGWNPKLEDAVPLCVHYQHSYERYGNCPLGYIESGVGNICYQQVTAQPWDEICLTTGGSSMSFLDLKSNEQYSIIQQLSATDVSKLNVGLPAKSKWPSKQITSEIDYGTEDIELQWLLPGRYGSILKLPNGSASVTCGYRNVCVEMCLSMNIAQSTHEKPFALVVDECANVNRVLCVSRKNSFVRDVGCSRSDYYRVSYSTTKTLSYSIKIFDEPLEIDADDDDSGTILRKSCEGNKIFHIDSLESHIIYRQLASVSRLGKHDRCLFGILLLNSEIRYTDWYRMEQELDPADLNDIEFTNWDKSVDFSTVYSRGDSYLTVNSDGLWRWERSATCIVCAIDDPPSQSELILQFNTSVSKLSLTVTDTEYLWRENNSQIGFLCFALISNNYIDVDVQSDRQSNTFLLANVGAGIYWCSGHIIQSIKFIQSKIVYAFGMVFAFRVNYHCGDECAEPLDGRPTEEFEMFLSALIDEDLMKIEGIQYVDHDPNCMDREVKIMFHVTVSVKEEISHGNEFNGIGLTNKDQLYTYYTLKELRHHDYTNSSLFDVLSIISREFCLPDSIALPNVLNWKAAKVGESVTLTEMCFNFTRQCLSNGSDGAVWNDYTFQSMCNNHSHFSHNLIDLHNNFQLAEQTPEVICDLSTTLHNATLNEADVFVVSEILEKISNFLLDDQVVISLTDLENICDIVNSLMLISPDVAIASSQLNSTNSILASFDELLLNQAQISLPNHHHSTLSDGVVSFKYTLLESYILDPIVSGFSGIAFIRNHSTEDGGDFQSYHVQFLQPNQSVETLLAYENLILASFVPQKLVEAWTNPIIIFIFFFNDILFQPYNIQHSADGSIVSLTILNSDSTKLSSSVPFFYKPNTSLFNEKNYMSAQSCGYWSLPGSAWDTTGCYLNEMYRQGSDTILCECSHLTHFGNLVNTEMIFSEIDEKVLNLITLAGCALSLVGIIGIFLTATVFRTWRSKSSSKFLLQLSAAIALQMVLLIFINSDDDVLVTISENLYGCIATGALIHYSILVMFFWMLIVAYLQFIRYVIVFNQIATANFLLKSSIFGWGMPMLPVFIVVAVSPMSYFPTSNVKFCYPSGYGLFFGLLIPIILIVLANMFVFAAVIISLIKGSSKSAACKVNEKNEAMWSQLRLSVFLFFILGLSWIFAFLSDRSILFSYLFCLTATLQGFVLFFYFVILDPIARNLWKRFFMKICSCLKRQ